jgi:hypothetical protein
VAIEGGRRGETEQAAPVLAAAPMVNLVALSHYVQQGWAIIQFPLFA